MLLRLTVVAPLLHAYVSGDVPPVMVDITLPFDCPHVVPVADSERVGGGASVTVVEIVAVHPLASVTVTLYGPASRFDKSSVVAPLLQLKVNGDVPPLTVKSTNPFALLQVD